MGFCSTIITTGIKKNLNRLISQPEKGAGHSVSDMLINMLSWNASVTHDTQLQRRDLDWQIAKNVGNDNSFYLGTKDTKLEILESDDMNSPCFSKTVENGTRWIKQSCKARLNNFHSF